MVPKWKESRSQTPYAQEALLRPPGNQDTFKRPLAGLRNWVPKSSPLIIQISAWTLLRDLAPERSGSCRQCHHALVPRGFPHLTPKSGCDTKRCQMVSPQPAQATIQVQSKAEVRVEKWKAVHEGFFSSQNRCVQTTSIPPLATQSTPHPTTMYDLHLLLALRPCQTLSKAEGLTDPW